MAPRGRPPKAIVDKAEPSTTGRAAVSRKRKSTLDSGTAKASTKRSRVDDEVVPKLKALKLQNSALGAQVGGDSGLPRRRGRPPGRAQPRTSFVNNERNLDHLAVYLFGDNDMGTLGLGPKGGEVSRPRLNPYLDPNQPAAFEVAQLSCGGMHMIALARDGEILTWGVNDNGALGRDTTWEGEKLRDMDDDDASSSGEDEVDLNPLESTPTRLPATSFPPGEMFSQVAAADNLSLALSITGEVYAWGTFVNHDGKPVFSQSSATAKPLEKQPTPVKVPLLKDITSITCGSNHCLALSSSGALYAWGIPDENRLGRRISPRHYHEAFTPHLVEIKNVTAIFSGNRHSFAIDAKDNVWSWGLNSYGQAGSNPDLAGSAGGVYLDRPRKIPSLCGKGVKFIAAGAGHSAAITKNGECYLWGRMDCGQLGIKFTEEQLGDPELVKRGELRNEPRICLRPTRITVPGLENVVSVACGIDHTIFVNDQGKAFSAGFGSRGQLGLGGEEDEVMVAKQIGAKSVRDVRLQIAAAGGNYSVLCALVEHVAGGQTVNPGKK